ncbi:hypothetical protein [Streptomyces goshikiensis]|uniref:hypothetical protein n=1 Tax=Streptomyces goshikiensis TaxID=1942 RepID=UPI0036D06F21
MRASEDLSGVIDTTTAWIEWALWLGMGTGVLTVAAGCVGMALARQSENNYVARNAGYLILRGAALGIGCGVLSVVLSLLTGRSDGGTSSSPKSTQSGDSGLTDVLMWGGLTLGGLTVAALAGWGVWRVRRRRITKRRRRQALERSHDTVAAAYGDYLGDVLEWLDRPTLSDVSVPETAALVQALAAADDARLGDDVDRYQRAVAVLRTAWQAADDCARRTGLRQLPPAERSAAEQARKLLATALDTGSGGEHERRAAYAKARRLLDGILVVPPQAVAALEDGHRLALAPKHL